MGMFGPAIRTSGASIRNKGAQVELAEYEAIETHRAEGVYTDVNIRFKQGQLTLLREIMLEDLSNEYFAQVLGKAELVNGVLIIKAVEIRTPENGDYNSQSSHHLDVKKDFVYSALAEIQNRDDLDCLIDVHTHPFAKGHVAFSGVDNRDEKQFHGWLSENFEGIHYASVVFSQDEYSARVWTREGFRSTPSTAMVKAMSAYECIPSSDANYSRTTIDSVSFDGIQNRTMLALGVDTMKKITIGQKVCVVGVGGLGSVISEHLIHQGFNDLTLIDHDSLEVSNLNRIVGASYEDAILGRKKVDVIAEHLSKINPEARVRALPIDVFSKEAEETIALSDWVIVGTDNHSSRFQVQELGLKYYVPFISAGVNITVKNAGVEDVSGEVITVRPGDCLCLSCLGRLNQIQIAGEMHPEKEVRDGLVTGGYVSGSVVKEPAVKTLNTVVATMAVDVLLNLYTGKQTHKPILVYENNFGPTIYEDKESVSIRNKNCYTCSSV